MKELLAFLIKNITGESEKNFDISESTVDGRTTLTITANPNIIGIIIGKEGKTIKNIRKIVAVKAVLQKTSVNISVIEKQ